MLALDFYSMLSAKMQHACDAAARGGQHSSLHAARRRTQHHPLLSSGGSGEEFWVFETMQISGL